jgi:hypothetical protein
VKYLYEDITLELGSRRDDRIVALCDPGNKGLKHIKRIRILRVSKSSQARQARLMCKLLLQSIPDDTLEEVRCDTSVLADDSDAAFELTRPGHADIVIRTTQGPGSPLSADALLLLYRKQRKLKWLEATDCDVLHDLKENTKLQANISHAKCLALYPITRSALDLCEFYLTALKDRLEELVVYPDIDDYSGRSRSRSRSTSVSEDGDASNNSNTPSLNDTATAPGFVTSTIFKSLLPFDSCTPLPMLTKLRLQNVHLRHCADTWCKVINFTNIKALEIYNCVGADALLDQMSKAAHLPTKLSVLKLRHRDNRDDETLVALDGFLCIVSGIEDLSIDISEVSCLPKATGIARHGKTLRKLVVHCSPGDHRSPARVVPPPGSDSQLVWDAGEFETICKATKMLEQLSCAWPTTSLIRNPDSQWEAFVTACSYLRNLITLQIAAWPSNAPSTTMLPRSVYEQLLTGLAKKIFSWAASRGATHDERLHKLKDDDIRKQAGKLRLIAFGVNEKVQEGEESKHQIIYLRSTATDAEGCDQIFPTPIGWKLRKYTVGKSEILDEPLSVTDLRIPTREREPGFGGWGEEDD